MSRRSWWLLALVIAALALAASANSISNGFAYDDVYLLVKSARMHSFAGWWREFAHTYWPEDSGGDGFRPLTIIAFRAQWAIGGGAPIVFHAVNIALHTITSVVVFWLACGLLPLAAAWVVAALYAVHPVHVEAFANVVGQSELWVALLMCVAIGLYVHGRIAGPITWKRWLAIGSVYATALLFKEHAIVLPALLILAEGTVTPDRAPLNQRLLRMRLPLLVLTVVALGYMWARSVVVVGGFSGFQPYIVFQALNLSAADRILTSVGAMIAVGSAVPWLYARLEQRRARQYAAATLLVAIIGLGVARSYTRAPAWHDNDSLFRQAVKDSPESYRAHFMLGVHL